MENCDFKPMVFMASKIMREPIFGHPVPWNGSSWRCSTTTWTKPSSQRLGEQPTKKTICIPLVFWTVSQSTYKFYFVYSILFLVVTCTRFSVNWISAIHKTIYRLWINYKDNRMFLSMKQLANNLLLVFINNFKV